MKKPLIYLIAGARPNFMKIAPIVRALRAQGVFAFKIVHTGQHYDHEMSGIFFEELGIPQPDVFLDARGSTQARQTAAVMVAFEDLCIEQCPDVVLVVGDVNSTLACALVAKKLQIPLAHVEAGLRSGDRSMPEEINRLATDSISDEFFVTEPSGKDNLEREGCSPHSIHFVGHVMVDNLFYQIDQLAFADINAFETACLCQAHLQPNERYGVVTLHRPSNVDDARVMGRIAEALRHVSYNLPLFFAVHPRTRKNLERFDIDLGSRVILLGPQPYMSFLNLWSKAALVLTDSGGLQEETTALGVPCITLRENTERPVTVSNGTNVLVGTDSGRIVREVGRVLATGGKKGLRPALWDGKAAERIVEVLAEQYARSSSKSVKRGAFQHAHLFGHPGLRHESNSGLH